VGTVHRILQRLAIVVAVLGVLIFAGLAVSRYHELFPWTPPASDRVVPASDLPKPPAGYTIDPPNNVFNQFDPSTAVPVPTPREVLAEISLIPGALGAAAVLLLALAWVVKPAKTVKAS
jgi:hypothetical protein